MALWIQNITPAGKFAEPVHSYKVAVNNEATLAFFEHRRADGDAACLRAAADAIELSGNPGELPDPTSLQKMHRSPDSLEKAARAVAEYFGEYDAMLANKREWTAKRGLDHTNNPVDVSGPFRDDIVDMARAVLMAVREPGMDVGLVGAEQVNIQMRGSTKADYCAAQDSFTAMIDTILNSDAS